MRMMLDIASLQQIFYFVEYPNNLSPTTSVEPIPTIPTISTIPTNSNNLNNLDHLADLRISPRLAAIAITEELSSPALGRTASK
jgi:hypothetical protein